MVNPAGQPNVAAQIGSHLRSNKFDITPKKLCKHVNDIILPNFGVENEHKKISEQTAARWLKKLGWMFSAYKKGFYHDAMRDLMLLNIEKNF
ncbi:12149_t:CDS:2 [Entrophospora sp. SA101]|nr:12149_t:CDS:2 [Entrophospora sp. SA101]